MFSFTGFALFSEWALAQSPNRPTAPTQMRAANPTPRAPAGQEASRLTLSPLGVPSLDLTRRVEKDGRVEVYRRSEIPRIRLPQERRLSLRLPAWTHSTPPSVSELAAVAILPPPTRLADGLTPLQAVTQVNPFQSKLPDMSSQTDSRLQAPSPAVTAQPQVAAVEPMTPHELKFLQAKIFFELHQNHPLALGLFAELADEKGPYQTASVYYLGQTALALGLYSEFKRRMTQLLAQGDLDWRKRAALSLAKENRTGDTLSAAKIYPFMQELKVEPPEAPTFFLNLAKHLMADDQLKESLVFIDRITLQQPEFDRAQFLKGLTQYKLGQVDEAILTFGALQNRLQTADPESNLASLTSINLARLLFQKGKYQDSFNAYLKVNRNHPDWANATIEQAWSQILAGDFVGAAGNMFTLHTEFYRNRFSPQSYLARTVGYLNLCQFGDSLKVVSTFDQKYKPFLEDLSNYFTQNPNPSADYELVRQLLSLAKEAEKQSARRRGPPPEKIGGLPTNLVWLMTREPAFLDAQESINFFEDEVNLYNRVTLEVLRGERQILGKLQELANQRAVAQNSAQPNSSRNRSPATQPNLSSTGSASSSIQASNPPTTGSPQGTSLSVDEQIQAYRIQHHIIRRARTAINELRKSGIAIVESEKALAKTRADEALRRGLLKVADTLKRSIDQTEILKYEIFSGAGEHLRFQLAGGEITPRENVGLRPEKDRSLSWRFKGEIWADELGFYRSSLKNVCAEPPTISADREPSSTENESSLGVSQESPSPARDGSNSNANETRQSMIEEEQTSTENAL